MSTIFVGIFVEDDWAYSFIVPGSIIAVGGFIIWLVLVPRPEDVNLSSDLSVRFSILFFTKLFRLLYKLFRKVDKPFSRLRFWIVSTNILYIFWVHMSFLSSLGIL